MLTHSQSFHSQSRVVLAIVTITEAQVRMPTAPSMIMLWTMPQPKQSPKRIRIANSIYIDIM